MLPFEAFFKDLRHSLRMFAQSPAFTLAAVAALTLGIGVNTAIFSVVNAVLLRPLSFPDPDRRGGLHEHVAAGVGIGLVAGEVHALPAADRPSSRTSRRTAAAS